MSRPQAPGILPPQLSGRGEEGPRAELNTIIAKRNVLTMSSKATISLKGTQSRGNSYMTERGETQRLRPEKEAAQNKPSRGLRRTQTETWHLTGCSIASCASVTPSIPETFPSVTSESTSASTHGNGLGKPKTWAPNIKLQFMQRSSSLKKVARNYMRCGFMENVMKEPWNKAGDTQADTLNMNMRYKILQQDKENSITGIGRSTRQASAMRPRYMISLRTGRQTPVEATDNGGGLFTNALIKSKIAEEVTHNPHHDIELGSCIREEDVEASPEKPRLRAIY